VAAAALLGFGIWQFTDIVLVHWLIGIHRVRVGVPNPLVWDIGWLVAFGVPTVLLGLRLLRTGDPPSGGSTCASPAAAMLSVLVLAGGFFPILGSSESTTIVIFRQGIGAPAAFAAAASINARVVWSDNTGEVLALRAPAESTVWSLYREGVLFVGNTSYLFGCVPALAADGTSSFAAAFI